MSSTGPALTLGQLAEHTGESLDALRRLISLGALSNTDTFGLTDVERVRMIQLLRRRGIDPDAVGAALQRQLELFERSVGQLYPDGDYPSISLRDAAATVGVDPSFAQRVRHAAGLGGPAELLTNSDVEALQTLALALQIGFPEQALLQLIRVYGDALNRVGEAEARLFHFYVHERLRAQGLDADAVDAATAETSQQLLALLEPTVLYFHRRGLTRAIREDLALHLAEDAGLLPPDDETGRLLSAVAFIDLARFTALTDVMGDATATDILDRFSDLVRRCVLDHDGRIIKQIGDAFMLVFGDPTSAVNCALDIRSAAIGEPQFLGTRQGLHWGPVLYREGDYYGATVNLAARIVAEASGDQILVSGDFRRQVHDPDLEFEPLGQRHVKHVSEPVRLFDVRRASDKDHIDRHVDPVCGMTLMSEQAAAQLRDDDGGLRWFCSADCLERFLATPEKFPPNGGL